MDEGVLLPKLELDCGANKVLVEHFSQRINDLTAMLKVALMIVRHIQDKQFLEVEAWFHDLTYPLLDGLGRSQGVQRITRIVVDPDASRIPC